jgi:DNA-binding SARP family transcriptional activator
VAWPGPRQRGRHEFADGAAARLAALKTAAQLARIEADLALGEAEGAVAVTTADPLAEPPRALLMCALAAAGRPAAALAEYQDLSERLADQLGADPAPAVTKVCLRILRGNADPLDRLADALAAADGVLILDNCEYVIESAAALAARLLADCPGVQVLATSWCDRLRAWM